MRTPTILLFAGAMCLSATAFAGQTTNTPVTTTIADADANGPLRIQSDGAVPYTNSSSVHSLIEGGSDWVLDTNYSRTPTRSAYIDFGDPIAGSGPGGGDPVAPFASALVRARFIAQCHQTNVRMFAIPAGSTAICLMATGFSYGGTDYRLAMNPSNYADTNWVNVTCQAAGSNGNCISWLLGPSAIYGTPKNSTKLLKIAKNGSVTDLGDFYMSFSISVTNP